MGRLLDPAAIYEASFAAIRRETALDRFPPALVPLVERIVHACGMPEIADDLVWHGDPARAGRDALEAGASILVDASMVAAGIMVGRLQTNVRVRCMLGEPETTLLGADLATTRSAAAVELWRPWLDGAVVVFGNAPTALFHLLDRLAGWPERPACILAFPVGFVGAAESKDALIRAELGIPLLTLRGRRGGSAMAAAAVNALIVANA